MLVVTLLLLTFMGDALRDALDPRMPDPPAKAPAGKGAVPASREPAREGAT